MILSSTGPLALTPECPFRTTFLLAPVACVSWSLQSEAFPAAHWLRVDPRKSLWLFRVVEPTEPSGKMSRALGKTAKNRIPTVPWLGPAWHRSSHHLAWTPLGPQRLQEKAQVPKSAGWDLAPTHIIRLAHCFFPCLSLLPQNWPPLGPWTLGAVCVYTPLHSHFWVPLTDC